MSECFITGATVFAQGAGITGLQDGEADVARLTEQYRLGHQIVVDILSDHSLIDLLVPEGVFYAFPRIRSMSSSHRFAWQLMVEQDVGVVPGYTFGPGNYNYIRILYAISHDKLHQGLVRIRQIIEEHHNKL